MTTTSHDESSPVQFARIRALLAGALDVACLSQETAGFAGDGCVHSDASSVLSALRASPLRLRPSRDVTAADGVALLLLRAGAAGLSVDGASEPLRPGDAVVLDLEQGFELRLLERSEVVLFWSRPLRDVAGGHGLVLSGAEPVGAMLGATLALFADLAPRADGRAFQLLGETVTELAMRSVQHVMGPAPLRVAAAELASFGSVRRFIDQNLASPKLDVGMIARAFGLSRASVYRLMAPLGGVAAYIREARLARGRRLVTNPRFADRRIAETAHLVGFRSVGVFNRLFDARYGMSPRAARDAALSNWRQADLWRSNGGGEPGELYARLRALQSGSPGS